MQSISLQDYTIYTGDCLDQLESIISAHHFSQVFVLVDENTREYCWPILAQKLASFAPILIEIKAGEIHKNLTSCTAIWQQLMTQKADRNAVLLNLGGGVIGDMGGFCAATFKRGFAFIQVPTTLLAQVDASIGGKLGIDFAEVKNSVGLFANPLGVFADPVFFKTLSQRELRSGFAEVIKHSLIADAEQWLSIKKVQNLRAVDWTTLVTPSLQIKQRIVQEDPFEHGLRKALNFGHTIGHAVESYLLESSKPLLHGEAIAVGMICEAYLSHVYVGLSESTLQEITSFIQSIYRCVNIPDGAFPSLISLMKNDKKNISGEINFSLLPDLGKVLINQSCSTESIAESIHFFNEQVAGG